MTISNGESDKFEQEIVELCRTSQKEIEETRFMKIDKDIIDRCMWGDMKIVIWPIDYINPDKVKKIYEERGYKWELLKDHQRLSWDQDSKLDAGKAYVMAVQSIERIKKERNSVANNFAEQIIQVLIWHAREFGTAKTCFGYENRIFVNGHETNYIFNDSDDILKKIRYDSEIIDDIRAVLNKEDIDITVDGRADNEYSVAWRIITIFSSIDENNKSMFNLVSNNSDQSKLTYGMKIISEAEHSDRYMSRFMNAIDENVLFEYFQIKDLCGKIALTEKTSAQIPLKFNGCHPYYHKLEILCKEKGFDTQISQDTSNIFSVSWNNAKLGTDAYKFLELSIKVKEEKKRRIALETAILIQDLIKSRVKEYRNIPRPFELDMNSNSNILGNIYKYKCFNEIKEFLPKCIEFTSTEREYRDYNTYEFKQGIFYKLNVKVDTNIK